MTGIHRPAFGGRRDEEVPSEIAESPEATAAAEDRALLFRLRSGEDAAFGELFSRHSAAVRRLALGLVNDRAEAEDLTAEAFFRVLQAIRRGSGPVDNVRGYLLIVARRVAWEWNGRRRDVPVSDEELNHRVGADPDTSGQSTERNLITRAFTSLPERWRSVLWKVEVEGERPAVVAVNFGLSPNATAALARRARQGLRAAYLQAHLTVDRGATGCRSVLEKLGAYTAGSIKGTERRKVRAHLSTCGSCTTMHAELQDVCSGLRAHAAYLAAPVAGVALWQAGAAAAPAAAGFSVSAKALLAGAKVQVALAAASAAAVGAFGLALVPWGGSTDDTAAFDDFDGAPELVITGESTSTAPVVSDGGAVPTKSVAETTTPPRAPILDAEPRNRGGTFAPQPRTTDAINEPGTETQSEPAARIETSPVSTYDENQPVVFQQSSYQWKWSVYDDREVVSETTTQTKVNAANQTTVLTQTTERTTYYSPRAEPAGEYAQVVPSPSPTLPAVEKPSSPGSATIPTSIVAS
ncbi:sigma-70 family RNA polymerase sigma factor [Actinokineospora sp.]|uniref:sigma-70 family RNA polymerase sigma factor n=1 Tax=Actinokineospora sp. TaxID=1872133 RepID=UPI004038447C